MIACAVVPTARIAEGTEGNRRAIAAISAATKTLNVGQVDPRFIGASPRLPRIRLTLLM